MEVMFSAFSDIAKSHYLFCNYRYFKLRKEVDNNAGWLQVHVRDYFEIISGYAFSSNDYVEEGIKVVRIGDISKFGQILYGRMLYLPEDYEYNYDRFLIEKGDILIGLTGDGQLFKTGIVDNLPHPILLNQRVGILRVKEGAEINPKFFFHLSKSNKFQNQIRIVAMGKAQKNVSPFDILKVRLPKVGFDKQNHIIQKIKPIENQIQSLQSQIKEPLDLINEVFIKELKFDWKTFEKLKNQSIQILELTDFANNKDLRVGARFHNPAFKFLDKHLSSVFPTKIKNFIADPIVLGKGVSPQEYDEEGQYYYISMADIKSWNFNHEDCKKITDAFYHSNLNKAVTLNDIIMARSGEGTIGKIAIIDNDEVEGIFADFTMRIRLKDYNPRFAYYYFCSEFYQYYVYTHKKGLGNNTNIFPSQVQEFPIPNFSIRKQEAIVVKIKSQLDRQKEIQQSIKQKQKEISNIIEKAINYIYY